MSIPIKGDLRKQGGGRGGIGGCAGGSLRLLRHGGRWGGRPHRQQEEDVQERLLHHVRRQGLRGKGAHVGGSR